jgi:hypothetical protein
VALMVEKGNGRHWLVRIAGGITPVVRPQLGDIVTSFPSQNQHVL